MIENYRLDKLQEKEYRIWKSPDAETPKKIFYSTTPDFINEKLIEFNKEDLSFKVDETNRIYLKLELKDGSYYLATRTLDIDGLINFRDIGGYFNKDNRQVKWGLLYRSDQPFNATEKGYHKILSLNLKSIFDYRSEDELTKYPNPEFPNSKSYSINPHAHTAELSAQFSAPAADEDEILVNEMLRNLDEDKSDSIIEQYVGFVSNEKSKEAFSKLIEVSALPDGYPLLHHCRGGKDRTGFGALLLLGLLDVEDAIIIYDYMLTRENRKERNAVKMKNYRKFTDNEIVLKQLLSLIDTEERFIKSALDIINDQYGDIKTYAKKELNITDEQIQELRNNYLY